MTLFLNVIDTPVHASDFVTASSSYHPANSNVIKQLIVQHAEAFAQQCFIIIVILKTMRVKLQPPTKVEMAAYTPIQPLASISQVMLLANPLKVCSSLPLSLSLFHNNYIHVHSIQSNTHPSDEDPITL